MVVLFKSITTRLLYRKKSRHLFGSLAGNFLAGWSYYNQQVCLFYFFKFNIPNLNFFRIFCWRNRTTFCTTTTRICYCLV